MKTNASLCIKKLWPGILLGAVSLVLLNTTSHAAEVFMYVKAYDTQWALIVPGSNTGGRVIWSPTYHDYITDRGNRGEAISVYYVADYTNERTIDCGGYSSCYSRNFGPVALPFERSGYVSTDPNCDNQHHWIWTNYGLNDVRLPIGGRP